MKSPTAQMPNVMRHAWATVLTLKLLSKERSSLFNLHLQRKFEINLINPKNKI